MSALLIASFVHFIDLLGAEDSYTLTLDEIETRVKTLVKCLRSDKF